jgi:hypothetical protein
MKDYKPKETILVITVGFLVMYMIFHDQCMLLAALIIGLTGVFSFYLSKKIDWIWGKLTLILGFLSNTIILTLCFYLVITPVALIRKLFVKKHMLSIDKTKTTNFEAVNHHYDKEDFVKPW